MSYKSEDLTFKNSGQLRLDKKHLQSQARRRIADIHDNDEGGDMADPSADAHSSNSVQSSLQASG